MALPGSEGRTRMELWEIVSRQMTISILDLDLTAADPPIGRIVAAYRRWLGIA